MKHLLKGVLAQNLLRHHRNRGLLHKLGAGALAFGRGRGMLAFGALALGSAYLKRRKARRANAARSTPSIPT